MRLLGPDDMPITIDGIAQLPSANGDAPNVLPEPAWAGWSSLGHWHVKIVTGHNGVFGDHIVCGTEEQARRIAEALEPLHQPRGAA
jgi:hypothetical protein